MAPLSLKPPLWLRLPSTTGSNSVGPEDDELSTPKQQHEQPKGDLIINSSFFPESLFLTRVRAPPVRGGPTFVIWRR